MSKSLNIEKVGLKDSLKFVEDTSAFIYQSFNKYGDFYKLTLPAHQIFVVISPEILQYILIGNENNYVKSKIYWGELHQMVGDALGTIEGEDWVELKKLQMRAFTREKSETYLETVLQNSLAHYGQWEQEGVNLDLIKCFSELNVSILLKTLFGVENSELCDVIATYISDGEEIISWRTKYPWRPFMAWFNGKNIRYKKYLHFFDDFSNEVIAQRKLSQSQTKKLIDLLIESSEFGGKELPLNKVNIRNEIIIYLGAGTETAAVGMGWALYLLQKYPHALQKVREEISLISKEKPLSAMDYKELPYSEAVIKEALRLYPPSHGIIRDAVKNDNINGLEIQAGNTFFVSAFGLHRNPRLWKQADDFIPERFFDEESIKKYNYIPFGAGRHTCIGRFLGLPMMVLSLAGFVQHYDYQMHLNEPILPVSLSTLKPNQPLLTTIKKRKLF